MKTKHRLLMVVRVLGIVLLFSPIYGIYLTVTSIMRANDMLGRRGIGDPKRLSQDIVDAMIPAQVAFFLFMFGVGLITVSVVLTRKLRAAAPPPLPYAAT